MPLILTTTGTAATVDLPEINVTLTHPETVNLTTLEMVSTDAFDADSIQAALDAGELTATDISLNPVTDVTLGNIAAQVQLLTSSSDPVSTDAGNLLINAPVDGKAFITAAIIQANQAEGAIAYVSGTQTLTYTGALGTVTNLDLSGLAADIYVDAGSVIGDDLVITDNDAGTPNVTIDFSSFRVSVANQGSGTWRVDPGNGSTVDIVTLSTDAGNLLTAGADNGLFIDQAVIQANETDTTLSFTQATNTLVYTNETGTPANVDISIPIDNLTDVDTTSTAPVAGDLLEFDGTNFVPVQRVYGTNYNGFSNTAARLTNSTTTYSSVISGNTTALAAGDYKITVSYSWNYNSQQNDFSARFLFDGAAVTIDEEIHRQEPKDSQGTLGALASNQVHGFQRMFLVSGVTAGVKTVALDFRSRLAGTEAAIWDAHIEIIRVA